MIPRQVPSAREHFQEIAVRITGKQVAVFLDYDGTLTPIVERPDQARLSDGMREAIRALARHGTVAIISGRDLEDVRALVSLEGLLYAGSHGFDIAGPQKNHQSYQESRKYLPVLGQSEEELRESLADISGAIVERKRFSIAVHYRRTPEAAVSDLEARVDDILARHPELRKTSGKKVFDLQPRIDWDKGKALLWLLKSLDLSKPDVLPFYIGDDVTDEHAFGALEGIGIGIVVGDEPRQTRAVYALEDPDDVKAFLEALTRLLASKSASNRSSQ